MYANKKRINLLQNQVKKLALIIEIGLFTNKISPLHHLRTSSAFKHPESKKN